MKLWSSISITIMVALTLLAAQISLSVEGFSYQQVPYYATETVNGSLDPYNSEGWAVGGNVDQPNWIEWGLGQAVSGEYTLALNFNFNASDYILKNYSFAWSEDGASWTTDTEFQSLLRVRWRSDFWASSIL